MGVDEDVIIKHSLVTGMDVTSEFMENILKAEETAKTFNAAVSLLSFKSRTRGELVSRLKDKGFDDSSIEIAVAKLKEYEYIDDYSYGKAFIKDKQKSSSMGKGLLKQKLLQKKLEPELISQLLDEGVTDEEEYNRALLLTQKKMKSFCSKDDATSKKRKIIGLLQRKGFSFEIINRVIKDVPEANDEY